MSQSPPAIRSVKARAVVVPLKRPLKNAFGVFTSAPLVLIDVETDRNVTGRAYIFAYANLTLKPLVHLIEEIGRELVGKAIVPFDLMAAMDACSGGKAWSAWPSRVSTWPIGMRSASVRARPWPNCLADRQNRSRPMTATAWSIR